MIPVETWGEKDILRVGQTKSYMYQIRDAHKNAASKKHGHQRSAHHWGGVWDDSGVKMNNFNNNLFKLMYVRKKHILHN